MNEEIVNVLEDKTIDDYIEDYNKVGTKIENMLKKLKNWGTECNCDDGVHEFEINAQGYKERQKLCTSCGGYLEW